MIKVKWEATHGYGDILGGYCHASRCAYQNDTEVVHEWLWFKDRDFYPPSEKYKEDPETVLERLDLIKQYVNIDDRVTFKETHLDYTITSDDPFGRNRPRYENRMSYDWKSTVWKMADDSRDDGHVAVWTSKKNKKDWRNHPLRHWKHPFSDEWYDDFIQKIVDTTGKKVIHVDYTIPVDEVFDIIRTASFCFGNDGIGNVIAKNYFKPIFVTSKDNGSITRSTSGNWAYIIDPMKPNTIISCQNFEAIVELQKYEIEEHRSRCY